MTDRGAHAILVKAPEARDRDRRADWSNNAGVVPATRPVDVSVQRLSYPDGDLEPDDDRGEQLRAGRAGRLPHG